MKKIIRSVCFFSKKPSLEIGQRFSEIEKALRSAGYEIQTKRLCAPLSIKEIGLLNLPGFFRCVATLTQEQMESQFEDFVTR